MDTGSIHVNEKSPCPFYPLGGRDAKEARALTPKECSMLRLLCSKEAVMLGNLANVSPVPQLRRSFASACGLLAFLYGDGIIEVCLTSTGKRYANARVNTPRPSTLFAGATWILLFASKRSKGSVFCNKGICGTSMTFKATIDIKELESYKLNGILQVKPGIRKDLIRCMEDVSGLYATVAGIIDSEGHVRKKARIIEIGMKDRELLSIIVDKLNSVGIRALGPRNTKTPLIELRVTDRAKPIIEMLINPEKRLQAMRMLVPDNITRTKIYREIIHKINKNIEASRKLPKKQCRRCAEIVLQEARALASTGTKPANGVGNTQPPYFPMTYVTATITTPFLKNLYY